MLDGIYYQWYCACMACTGPVVLYMYNILDLVLALAATVATTSYSV